MPRRPVPVCPAPECRHRRTRTVRHSVLRTRLRAQRRYRCAGCGGTFAANAGTAYHRLWHAPKLFDQVIALAVEGTSRAATARALGISPSTLARWLKRAAQHAEAFNDARVRGIPATEIQTDELRASVQRKRDPIWAYTAVEVWSRLWISSRVGRRTLRNTYLHYREVRWRCKVGAERTLLTSDSFNYKERVASRVFGPTCIYAQVDKRLRENRIVRVNERLLIGTDWMLEKAIHKSEDSKRVNTAFVERLNLTLRRSLACLQRKTTAVCRSEQSLHAQLEMLRRYYSFLRPHSTLKFGRERRTPVQQAGLANRRLSWRAIFTARILGTPSRKPLATMPDAGRTMMRAFAYG